MQDFKAPTELAPSEIDNELIAFLLTTRPSNASEAEALRIAHDKLVKLGLCDSSTRDELNW